MALKRTPPARGAPQDAGLTAGISGMAMDLPPYRVSLEDWCGWTGASWDKISAVRHCLPEDSAAIVICSDLALYARGGDF